MSADTSVVRAVGDVLTAIDLRLSDLSYQKIGAQGDALEAIRTEQQVLSVLRSSLDDVQRKLVRSGLALNAPEYVDARAEMAVASREAQRVLAQLQRLDTVIGAIQKVLAIGVKVVSFAVAAV